MQVEKIERQSRPEMNRHSAPKQPAESLSLGRSRTDPFSVTNRHAVKRFRTWIMAFFLFLLACGPGFATDGPNDPAAERIRTQMATLRATGGLSIGDHAVAAITTLPVFYERRDYRRAWTRKKIIYQLLEAIEDSTAEGLDPIDYHFETVKAAANRSQAALPADRRMLADTDILLTDSLMRLTYHFIFGKVDPQGLSPYLNLVRIIDGPDPLLLIQRAVESDLLDSFFDSAKPKHPFYQRLKKALATYRSIQNSGGWGRIPENDQLVKGMRDGRVIQLRRRLQLTGDLKDGRLASDLFDEHLEGALIRFQIRHYLEPDGIANRVTLQVLNESVQERIDQIRVNLERARWIVHGVPDTFVIVDIAGYRVHYVRNDQIAWSARAQVGRPFRQTPAFKSEIRRLVLSPTWTVPPGIFYKDLLPEVKKDPQYLNQLGIGIYTTGNRIIDAKAIDWSKYPQQRFPYTLRQNPGQTNPLGHIKFVIPNPYYIYLHDTPEQENFDSPWRAFSAGCIRVEFPFELAELLLEDAGGWDIEQIRRQVKKGRPTNIDLPSPPPVLFLYMTVWVDENQVVYFREDVYQRDARILEGLAGEFRIREKSMTLDLLM